VLPSVTLADVTQNHTNSRALKVRMLLLRPKFAFPDRTKAKSAALSRFLLAEKGEKTSWLTALIPRDIGRISPTRLRSSHRGCDQRAGKLRAIQSSKPSRLQGHLDEEGETAFPAGARNFPHYYAMRRNGDGK
jgi:hypothetical protein